MNANVRSAFENVVEACEQAFFAACKEGSWTERLVAAGLHSIAVDALEDIRANGGNEEKTEKGKVIPSANYA